MAHVITLLRIMSFTFVYGVYFLPKIFLVWFVISEYFYIAEIEKVLTIDFAVEIKIVDPIWITKKVLKSMCTCQRKSN